MFYDLNREWTKNLVVRFVLALILTFPGFITTCVGIYLLVRGKQPAKHWAVGPWVSAYGALYLSRKENFWVDVDRRLATWPGRLFAATYSFLVWVTVPLWLIVLIQGALAF